MNETGANYLNQLIRDGRSVMMSITARELTERIHAYIFAKTGVSLPFEMETDIQTGKAYMELELDEIPDEDNTLMVKAFDTTLEEFYVLTDVIFEELFGSGACAYLSEEAENGLMDEASAPDYYFTLHLGSPDIRFNVPETNTTFAHVSWDIQDILEAFYDLGFENVTEEMASKVLETPRFEKTLQEMMISRGWDVIKDIIPDVIEQDEEENNSEVSKA